MTTSVTSTGVRAARVAVARDPYGPDTARLSFDNGLERLDLRGDPSMTGLLEAEFADPYPVTWADQHNVHVEYPLGSRLLRRMRANSMRLSPAVSWSLDVHGGAAHLAADLSDLRVRSLSFHSGVARARLALGPPEGQVTLRLSSLLDLTLVRPASVPVRIELSRGAREVRLDTRHVGAVGDGLSDETPGYSGAVDRYLVVVTGGVDRFTVAPA
jgi:hypothetical protein